MTDPSTPSNRRIENSARGRRVPLPLAGLALLGFALPGLAQTVLAPPPPPPAFATPGNLAAPALVGSTAGYGVRQSPLFQWGRFEFRPHLAYQFLYADGLLAGLAQLVPSYIHTFSPGLLVEAGENWSFDYTARWTSFSSSAFRETLGHAAALNGTLESPGWTVALSQRYSATDDPMIETARQTEQEIVTTTVRGAYQIGRRVSAILNGEQRLTFTEALADTYEWTLRPEIAYSFSSTLRAGVSLGSGYLRVDQGSDMTYLRPLASLSWQPGRKTSIELLGGVDRWRFVSGNRSSFGGVYYRAAVRYNPFDATVISLSGERSLSAAPFRDQATQLNSWELRVNQRVLTHLQFEVRASHRETTYVGAPESAEGGREDEQRSYDGRLSTTFLGRGSVAAIYRWSRIDSNVPGYGFTSSQVGFEIGYEY